jgi:uncharacterized membrane protein
MAERTEDRGEGRRVVRGVLVTGLIVGMLLVAAGLLLALLEGDTIARAFTPAAAVAGHGLPPVLIGSGILVLAATPIVRVLALIGVFARRRDLRFAAVAATVALLLAIGVVLGRG